MFVAGRKLWIAAVASTTQDYDPVLCVDHIGLRENETNFTVQLLLNTHFFCNIVNKLETFVFSNSIKNA